MATNKQTKRMMRTFAAAHGIVLVKMTDNDGWGLGAKANAWRLSGWARAHGRPNVPQKTAKTPQLLALLFPAPVYVIRHDYHAVNHGGSRALSSIKYIVLHDMEYTDLANAAEALGRMSAGSGYGASPHYGVDNDSIQEYLPISYVGWHTTSFNSTTVGIEQAGRAANSRATWLQTYAGTLDRTAWLVARLARQTGIPIAFRNAAYLRAHGANPAVGGVTTHLEHTRALQPGDHTDPGVGYPMDALIAKAKAHAAAM
jgi:hypothetical protein